MFVVEKKILMQISITFAVGLPLYKCVLNQASKAQSGYDGHLTGSFNQMRYFRHGKPGCYQKTN